jgi:hypothetical protein
MQQAWFKRGVTAFIVLMFLGGLVITLPWPQSESNQPAPSEEAHLLYNLVDENEKSAPANPRDDLSLSPRSTRGLQPEVRPLDPLLRRSPSS